MRNDSIYSIETLEKLDKEQLIWLVKHLQRTQSYITETCVEESKCHLDPNEAIWRIREHLWNGNLSSCASCNVEEIKNYFDFEMGKISQNDYRKLMGYTTTID